jgi:DNA-binding transcriptional LysR family regulator
VELREFRSLVALAETGSILQAAQRCHLSPAAVHKHLKTLEGELGVRLYTKGVGRLVLTPAGEMLLPHARDILIQQEAARTALTEWKEGSRGRVRVGAGPSFSSHLLPSLLKRFRRHTGAVDVYVETGASAQLVERLKDGSLDLIFDAGAAALEDPELEQVAAWRSLAGFVAAKGQVPPYCRLRDLETMPFILFQKGTRMEPIVQGYFGSLNFRPRVVMRSDSAEAIKAMIRANLGVSVLFWWNVGREERTGAFTLVRTEAPPLQSVMTLVKVRTTFTPRAVQAFMDLAASTEWPSLPLFRETGDSTVVKRKSRGFS